jgi:hypothetical protein
VREQPVETHRVVYAQEPTSSSSTCSHERQLHVGDLGLGGGGRSSWERRKEREELMGMGRRH